MKLAIYHGYELSGSGSNEYTRYLARTLADSGHAISLICREPGPEQFPFVDRAVGYTVRGEPTELFRKPPSHAGSVTLHRLPQTSCYPVYVNDKQRPGNVKSFTDMTDDELREYHDAMVAVVERVLRDERPELMHVNHLVYQPQVALAACRPSGTPFYTVSHGSAIEYTVKPDPRFRAAAREGLLHCSGLVWITREVRERVCMLYPELRREIEEKSRGVGVGTDTSLFRPLSASERPGAMDELKSLHVRGGKSPEQRLELRGALDRGEIDAVTRYRDAYDHALADDDLPEILDRIPLDGELMISVGAMTYGKGMQSLIAALPGICSNRPRAHLVLVGSGAFREALEGLLHALDTGNADLFDGIASRGSALESGARGSPLDDLQAYAADPAQRETLFQAGRGISRRVHFLGRLNHPMLRCIFPCCRLSVFPSVIHEASPLVFYESMANGVLPTGAYHSGLREGIDELRGHLDPAIGERIALPTEPKHRVRGIVERLSTLLGDPRVAELGPRLRELAVENNDWRAVAESLIRSVSPWARQQGPGQT